MEVTDIPIAVTDFEVRITNSDNDLTLEDIGVKVYPNPVGDYLYVDSENEINQITVTDLYGKVLLISTYFDKSNNLSSISAGTYIVQVKSKLGNANQKIIKL